MRRIEDGMYLPRPDMCIPSAQDEATATLPPGLDDPSLAYVIAARPVFDEICALIGQLSSLLVLRASGARSAQDHPMFVLILDRRGAMQEGLTTLNVPTSAGHHHRHLSRAARAASVAVRTAERRLHQRDDASLDAIIAPLRRAQQELRWATAALPGFGLVDLHQACCAAHSAIGRLPTSSPESNHHG